MCIDHSITCACGRRNASFNFKDELLPREVIDKLYCPDCSVAVLPDPTTMLQDNGWIIDYNMDAVRLLMPKLFPAHQITPEFIFDEGYCTWRGVTPSDSIDSLREREQLTRLARTDPRRYFEEIKAWGNKRMERLAQEGWRKAYEREHAKT